MSIYTNTIKYFGVFNQFLKTAEECAELQKELIKAALKDNTEELSSQEINNICEEICDVEILLSQLRTLNGFAKKIDAIKKLKLKRLKGLISG